MATEELRLQLWQGSIGTRVDILGEGPPLVWLHGPWGLRPEIEFLARLAEGHRVYAPWHPGTSPDDAEAIHRLDDWLDLVVYHAELFDALGLAAPDLIGHSCGGMLAAECAAAMPERVGRLVLIDALGLWQADRPVRNWMIMPEENLRPLLFADPAGPAAAGFFSLPADPETRAEAQAGHIWSQACTGKFLWPIPDKGLGKRLHRVRAPTLVLWGERDGIADPAYAGDFAQRIAGAQAATIPAAGHLPYLEQPEAAAQRLREFLLRG